MWVQNKSSGKAQHTVLWHNHAGTDCCFYACVCWCCSIDYPVKWFVVVASEEAVSGRNAIAYQLKHLQEYAQDKVGKLGAVC